MKGISKLLWRIFMLFPTFLLSQQIGQTLLGSGPDNRFGQGVSCNAAGDIVAVGAPFQGGGGNGAVQVFRFDGTQWVVRGTELVGEASGDTFGFAVSLSASGDVLAVGAQNNDGVALNSGHLRVYEWNGSNYILAAEFDADDANDNLGISVSVSDDGSTVAAGAFRGNADDSGYTRIYRNNAGNWAQIGTDINGEAGADWSGYRVSLNADGNRVIIGAPLNDSAGNNSNSGHARVFLFDGTQWVQIGQDVDSALSPSGQGRFGWSVAINDVGDRIVVSSRDYGDQGGSFRGLVRVFELNTGQWVQIGQDILGDAVGNTLGSAVTINGIGNIIAASAPLVSTSSASGAGRILKYEFSGGTWNEIFRVTGSESNGRMGEFYFGLTSSGDITAVGSYLATTQNGGGSGLARVFGPVSPNNPPDIAGCPSNMAQDNDTGQCAAVVNWTAPTASDSDGTVVSFTATHNPGDSFPVGTTTVIYTATDDSGDTATCSFDVTVNDVEAPIVVTSGFGIALNTSGQVTIVAADVDDGSSDNCGIQSLTLDRTDFDCSDLGSNMVTLTVTDTAGNLATATAQIIIQDVIAPTAVTQDITVQLDASGNASITAADINNGSSDNCSIASLSLDRNDFACADLGQNTVTLTVTDIAGNTDTATATVTVQEDPNQTLTAIAQDITVALDANGVATIAASDVDNGSGSGCNSNPSLSLDRTNFNCDDLGTNTVILTVTDGNSSDTATATVTVVDNLPPIVVTQDITVQLDINGQANISVSDVEGTYSDNCQVSTQILDITDFDCGDLGVNTVTVTIGDSSGNTATGTAIVTIVDSSVPTAIAKDITIQLDASGSATILPEDVDNGSADNCSIANLALDRTIFTCSDLGQNTITLTATDESGNTATTNAIVTVEEDPNQPLTAVTQDITVALDANGLASIAPSDVDNGSGSGCNSNPTLSLDQTNFNCDDIGQNMVTLTVTEGNNTANATATVTVVDNMPPVAATKDITVVLDGNGQATIVPQDIDNESADNCTGTASLTYALDVTSFNCDDLGNNSVQLTVTDAHGNSASATSTVTVTETTPPNIVTQNIAIVLDNNGQASISAMDIDNGSTDTCSGIASMSLDIDTFTCPNLGNTTVTLTVTDNQGNTSMGTAIVTISAVDENNNSIPDSCENQALKVSKGFSPNGDNTNDTWIIENIEDYPNSLVQVFNLWGEKVFEKKAYQNDWDGVANQGSATTKLPVGSYFFVIKTYIDGVTPVQGWLYINY